MLEMICADFLAGAKIESGNSNALILSLERLFGLLPQRKQQRIHRRLAGSPELQIGCVVSLVSLV